MRANPHAVGLALALAVLAGAHAATAQEAPQMIHGDAGGAFRSVFDWTSHVLVGAAAALAGVFGYRAWSRRRWRRPPAGIVTEAVLVIDLVDSTKLATHYGESPAMRARNFLEQKMLDKANARGVTSVESTGDGCMSTFPSVAEATRTAVALRRRLQHAPPELSSGGPLEIRAAVTYGEILIDARGKRHGTEINKAFRLMGVARDAFVAVAGEAQMAEIPDRNRIFLDEDAANELQSSGVALGQVGVCRLKGFSGFHRVYELR